MEFLSTVLPTARISVMYFDEAHELGLLFLIFLRLVKHQLLSTGMWYTFMGTKSSISYHASRPGDNQFPVLLACTYLTEAIVHSLRLLADLAQLLPPYIDLDFDQ